MCPIRSGGGWWAAAGLCAAVAAGVTVWAVGPRDPDPVEPGPPAPETAAAPPEVAPPPRAAGPDGPQFYEQTVRTILAEHCYACHSHAGGKSKAGLVLDLPEGWLKGGDSGPAVVPGNPDKSLLIQAVRHADPDLAMPPKKKLADADVAYLERWVVLGAPGPAAPTAKPGTDLMARAKTHWSFRPVREPPLPAVKDRAWPTSPVDHFVLAGLERAGLSPAPPADPRTLLRRVTFDLTGLPPTPEEVEAFLADTSPGAYEKVVDRLLASPHYGERWARHWLDLVRFAETNGFNRDFTKPNMWRYRDYLIDGFNADLPFDEMIREQVTGDLLPPRPTADGKGNARLPATGLWWSHELVYNPPDPAEQRADQVDAQIDILSKAFLGLSVSCARCHDHKLEAIPTRDYYALAGVFHSTKGVQRPLAAGDGPPPAPAHTAKDAVAALTPETRREVARTGEYLKAALPLAVLAAETVARRTPDVAAEKKLDTEVLRRWIAVLRRSDSVRHPVLGPLVELVGQPPHRIPEPRAALLARKDTGALGGKPFNPLSLATLDDLKTRDELIGRFQALMLRVLDEKRADDPAHRQWLEWFAQPGTPYSKSLFPDDPAPADVPAAMACAEADDARYEVWQARVLPQAPNAWSLPPDPTVGDVRIHVRGQVGRYGDPAPRGFLSSLPGGGPAAIPKGSGRLELAEWLAGKDNPLPARVLVNRLWQFHFGAGIVETPNDFGFTGAAPSHPELLDYLAARLVAYGWSVKKMHRLMVLSSAYRMSSRPAAAAAERDPSNRLLHHVPVRRLEAEAVRDAILAVAGSLDPKTHGPGVAPYVTEFMPLRYRPEPGPLDGGGRRSVYLTVRRNFLNPLLLAFDFPNPSEPVGRRNSSNVPTQALALLNNEFVHDQARRWAEREAKVGGAVPARAARMFERALGRPPADAERAEFLGFLGESPDETAWADFAHVLFNTKGFCFIR